LFSLTESHEAKHTRAKATEPNLNNLQKQHTCIGSNNDLE